MNPPAAGFQLRRPPAAREMHTAGDAPVGRGEVCESEDEIIEKCKHLIEA